MFSIKLWSHNTLQKHFEQPPNHSSFCQFSKRCLTVHRPVLVQEQHRFTLNSGWEVPAVHFQVLAQVSQALVSNVIVVPRAYVWWQEQKLSATFGRSHPTIDKLQVKIKEVVKDILLPATETVAWFSISHPILVHKICSQFSLTTSIFFFKENEEHTHKSWSDTSLILPLKAKTLKEVTLYHCMMQTPLVTRSCCSHSFICGK